MEQGGTLDLPDTPNIKNRHVLIAIRAESATGGRALEALRHELQSFGPARAVAELTD
jgi:hypothetical protein